MEKITKSSKSILIDPNEPLILPDGTALVGRIEWFLYALCCLDYQNLPTPMSRIEEFANALVTGEIPNIEPQSRAEQFFLAILDGNISNLPQPQSRSEVLLDKLARGEFDLSDVEPIQSHYELLLAYLIKNGGIGNIDYVLYEFSEAMKTMYNTVEKPFKSLELSGNTKVNVLQESVENDVIVPYQVNECQDVTLTGTKETGSLDNLVINGRTSVNSVLEDTSNSDYVAFDQNYEGQSFTINGTNEGAIKSAILKGQTLVNLHPQNKPKIMNANAGWFEDLKTETNRISFKIIEGQTSWRYIDFGVININLLKPNTKYLVRFKELKNITHVSFMKGDSSGAITNSAKFTNNCAILTTTSNLKPNNQVMYLTMPQQIPIGEEVIASYPILIEYVEGMENWDIPYFSGMQSVKMPVLTTTGKNLFDGEYVFGAINDGTGQFTANGNSWCSKNFTKIPKNTAISVTSDGNFDRVFKYNKNKEYLGWEYASNKTFTGSLGEAEYIKIRNSRDGNAQTWLQVEIGEPTTYEPHKSNILTVNEEVELRGIGDVKDTLDLVTGEVTERIAIESLKDINWIYRNDGDGSSTISFNGTLKELSVGTQSKAEAFCDGFIIDNSSANGVEGFGIENNSKTIYLEIKREKLNGLTASDLITYLTEKDYKIIYRKSNYTIKTVDLNVVDQNNTRIDKIHVFDGITHVNASSDELLPTVKFSKSVSYPTIIKPNTKYTVDLKRNDKPLTVNLGGTEVAFADGETRKIITTPSTLTNDKLSYYGMGQKCSDIMVLEGEVEGNVDYFTDMQSVANPILRTVGKNLIHVSKGYVPTAENRGITISRDEINQTITLNGTSTIDNNCFALAPIDNLKILKGETYTITAYLISGVASGNYSFRLNDKGWSNAISTIIGGRLSNTKTYVKDALYIESSVRIDTGATFENAVFKVQFEKNTASTSYEPHKSTILSCDEEVVLRQVGDIKDTLSCNIGEYTQRICEVVLDGSEDWQGIFSVSGSDDLMRFYTGNKLGVIPSTTANFYCNKFKVVDNRNTGSISGECVFNNSTTGSFPNGIQFQVSKEKATTLVEWKCYLSENPITIQYPTITPIIKTINLSIVDQDNIAQTKLHTFNDTTHIMTNSDELTPIIKCDGKLEYPVVIKPSTQYTILANTSANGHVLNNIAFDLGGAKVTNTFGTRKITVTTPSTLTDNSLTITGEGAKVNELMVLEGNESDTLPYFEGMSSCKMPILSTVGKNLFDKNTANLNCALNGDGTLRNLLEGENNNVSDYIPVKGNTQYVKTTSDLYCEYDINKNFIRRTGGTMFTTSDDCKFIRINVADIDNHQLEEGSIATAYEPYKTSILSCNDDVTLRGIGGVQDTLNCLTGELTQRVGESVYKGDDTEYWFYSGSVSDDLIEFARSVSDVNKIIACDRLPISGTTERFVYASNKFYVRLLKSRLVTQDIDGFKKWLASNPLTIQYQFATESVKTVDLNVVDQDGNVIPKIKSYKDVTHLEVTVPKQSLLPHISAEVATDNSKDMSSLTTKHQEISETQSAIQDNIQSQSDEIDTALMATTEIFESILE